MKYVPDLIPQEFRVDITPPISVPVNPTANLKLIGSYVLAGIFLIAFLGTIFTRFWQGLVALSMGLLLLPQIHRVLEEKLRFTFTWIIKSSTLAILFLILSGLMVHYNHVADIKADQQRLESIRLAAEEERISLERKKQEEQLRIEREKEEKRIEDTVSYFKTTAAKRVRQGNYHSAVSFLSQGLQVKPDDSELLSLRAKTRYDGGSYRDAASDYSKLIYITYNRQDCYYQRALCYLKIGNKKDAVADLKEAMNAGNKKAEKMYNHVNPLKRRVIGHVTRCCDGSTSSSTGRGTCSHHRGVCDWNEPIYQEYRDYE